MGRILQHRFICKSFERGRSIDDKSWCDWHWNGMEELVQSFYILVQAMLGGPKDTRAFVTMVRDDDMPITLIEATVKLDYIS